MDELKGLLAGTTGAGSTALDPGLERMRAALARRAEQQGLLDIAYRTVDTPVGRLLLAATPVGLVRVAYPRQDHEAVLADLAARISPRVLHAPARLDEAARQLDEYFTYGRRGFELPLDLRLARGFRRTVIESLPTVGYGQTTSYASLAADVENPRAVRAVGTACATNPLPLIIPCHRVVRSDGTPGAYVGGPDAKTMLLRLEAGS